MNHFSKEKHWNRIRMPLFILWVWAAFLLVGMPAEAAAAKDIEVTSGESIYLGSDTVAGKIYIAEGGTLSVSGSLRARELIMESGATVDAASMRVGKVELAGNGETFMRVQRGCAQMDKVVSDTEGTLVVTYELTEGLFIRESVQGAYIRLCPMRSGSLFYADREGISLATIHAGISAQSFRLAQSDGYTTMLDADNEHNLVTGEIKLYMVTEYEDGSDAPAQVFAALSDAIAYIHTLKNDAGNRIFMLQDDYLGRLTIQGGHNIRIYQDVPDCTLYIEKEVIVRGKNSSLTISGPQLRDEKGLPASYTVKRNASLFLKDTKVGNISMTSQADAGFDGNVRVMGEVTGSGNLTISGNSTYTFMGDVNVHNLLVDVDAQDRMPELLFLMNKKLTIAGAVVMDTERIVKKDGILLSYAYMTDPDQLTYAGDIADGSADFSATIEHPFYIALAENATLVQAVSNGVLAGMFRLRNTNALGEEWYLAKTDRFIRTSSAAAILYKMNQSTGQRTSAGALYGGMKEAMEAINYSGDYDTYEISLLANVNNIDLSGGMPSRLRLLSSAVPDPATGLFRKIEVKTKKDILLLGHLNVTFVELEAPLKTLYANDKNLTLVYADAMLANMSHCNILTLGDQATLTIAKEGNTINEANVVSETARIDCPQYATFRADDLEQSILAKDAKPSKKATEDAYKRAVDYLVNATYEIPWNKVLFLGDSITRGVQSGVDVISEDATYPFKFQDRLGVEICNAGIGGSTIWRGGGAPMVTRCTDYGDGYDAIFLLGGINDWFYGYECPMGDVYTEGTFAYDLNRTLDLLSEKYPDADIFVILPLEPKEHAGITPYEDLNTIRNVERALAKAHDCYVIDLYSQGVLCATDEETKTEYYSDSVHPNSVGYEFLGTILAAQSIEMVNW